MRPLFSHQLFCPHVPYFEPIPLNAVRLLVSQLLRTFQSGALIASTRHEPCPQVTPARSTKHRPTLFSCSYSFHTRPPDPTTIRPPFKRMSEVLPPTPPLNREQIPHAILRNNGPSPTAEAVFNLTQRAAETWRISNWTVKRELLEIFSLKCEPKPSLE